MNTPPPPVLVFINKKTAIDYRPIKGDGPSFRHEFVLTPDGILATLRSTETNSFGVTWPLLTDDGAPLLTNITDHLATTAFRDGADQQCFLSLDGSDVTADGAERTRSTYGWLVPVRAMATEGVNRTFVYPRSPGDAAAETVRASFRVREDGFETELGAVHGTLYTSRTSAGGEGKSIDCDGDNQPDATFDAACQFVLQLRHGKIVAVEADRKTAVQIRGKRLPLEPYRPLVVQEASGLAR